MTIQQPGILAQRDWLEPRSACAPVLPLDMADNTWGITYCTSRVWEHPHDGLGWHAGKSVEWARLQLEIVTNTKNTQWSFIINDISKVLQHAYWLTEVVSLLPRLVLNTWPQAVFLPQFTSGWDNRGATLHMELFWFFILFILIPFHCSCQIYLIFFALILHDLFINNVNHFT